MYRLRETGIIGYFHARINPSDHLHQLTGLHGKPAAFKLLKSDHFKTGNKTLKHAVVII